MSVGLDPIFNYIVNKFTHSRISDSSSFDEYFTLYPDTAQFGYKEIVGLKSNSTYRSTLCLFLILAQELDFLKIPFNRTKQLQQIICSFLDLDLGQAYNKQYLKEKYQQIKITTTIEKKQTMNTQQSGIFKTNTENSNIQQKQNPFGDLSSFMKTPSQNQTRKTESITFEKEKLETKKIFDWGKSGLFSQGNLESIQLPQGKCANQLINPSKKILCYEDLLKNKKSDSSKIEIKSQYKNSDFEEDQTISIQFSKRHIIELDTSQLTKGERFLLHQQQQLREMMANQKSQSKEQNITSTSVTKENDKFPQLNLVEEKVTEEIIKSRDQLPQTEKKEENITPTSVTKENDKLPQLNLVEEKVTEEIIKPRDQLPQTENKEEKLIQENNNVIQLKVVEEKVTVLEINSENQQLPDSWHEKKIENQVNDVIKNEMNHNQIFDQILINPQSQLTKNQGPKRVINQNSQTKNLLKKFYDQNEWIIQVNQQLKSNQNISNQELNQLQFQQVNNTRELQFWFELNPFKKKKKPSGTIQSPVVTIIKFFYLIRIKFKMRLRQIYLYNLQSNNQIDKDQKQQKKMTTPFLHPITGIYHFHQFSLLCFSQKQIEGIKRYMQILSFFYYVRKRPECLNFSSFLGCIKTRLEQLQLLKRTIGLTKQKRRILSRKIMEILIQEDDNFIEQNQSIVHHFLDNQFTEYTKDLKKVTNFRRTNN